MAVIVTRIGHIPWSDSHSLTRTEKIGARYPKCPFISQKYLRLLILSLRNIISHPLYGTLLQTIFALRVLLLIIKAGLFPKLLL